MVAEPRARIPGRDPELDAGFTAMPNDIDRIPQSALTCQADPLSLLDAGRPRRARVPCSATHTMRAGATQPLFIKWRRPQFREPGPERRLSGSRVAPRAGPARSITLLHTVRLRPALVTFRAFDVMRAFASQPFRVERGCLQLCEPRAERRLSGRRVAPRAGPADTVTVPHVRGPGHADVALRAFDVMRGPDAEPLFVERGCAELVQPRPELRLSGERVSAAGGVLASANPAALVTSQNIVRSRPAGVPRGATGTMRDVTAQPFRFQQLRAELIEPGPERCFRGK